MEGVEICGRSIADTEGLETSLRPTLALGAGEACQLLFTGNGLLGRMGCGATLAPGCGV
jgi:hypothetical protein